MFLSLLIPTFLVESLIPCNTFQLSNTVFNDLDLVFSLDFTSIAVTILLYFIKKSISNLELPPYEIICR